MSLATALIAAALLLGAPASATTTFSLPDGGVGPWHDVNKRGTGDYYLCWAAVAANLLSWGGWAGTGYQSDEQIYGAFIDSWTDQPGLASNGINWWITGRVIDYGAGWASVDVSGNGGYLPDLKPSDYLLSAGRSGAGEAIVDYLSHGYGTAVGIYTSGTVGHALTIWGFDLDATSGTASGIHFTDSDDGITGLGHSAIHFDASLDRWILDDWLGGGWYIGNVVGLKPVPEPSSLSLLGMALSTILVVVALRRRRSGVVVALNAA